MTEEEISASGQYPALGSVELSTSYQAPAATPAPPAAARAAVTDAGQPVKEPTSEEIASAIALANTNLASSGRELDYRLDAATGISIAVIRNSQTGAVMQQIPGTNIIALARMLADWAPGKHMLLDLIA
ncbi:MAG: flagellar protein FlaG [Steroidobacteraceae bacterium]